MIEAKGYGARIRQLVFERASQMQREAMARGERARRYTDTQFAADVGMAERGKPYSNTTVGDWLTERNEPAIASALAMEAVLERPGAAVYIFFGCWPSAAEGVATPGAVRSTKPPRVPMRDPRPAKKSAKKAVASGGARKPPRR